MIEWLKNAVTDIQSVGSPWLVTVVGVGILLYGSKAGLFHTSATRLKEIVASRDNWAALRFATREAVTTALMFGTFTVIAVLWDRWWLTGPLGLLLTVMMLPTLLQDLLVVGTSIPLMAMQPKGAVPIALSTSVRLAGDAVHLVFLGLVIIALWT
jgi:hypothetical protein